MTRFQGTRLDPDRWDAIILDVDGTLYEQAPLRRRMIVELLAHVVSRPWRLGLLGRLQAFRRERERLAEEEVGGIARLQYERPAARLGVAPDALRAEVEEWIHRRPLRHLAGCRVAGARRLFAALRLRGTRIAVYSDYPAVEKLAALGLSSELVVSADDPGVDRLKPHPAGLEAVLARLELPRERCLMIGDRDDRDGACARRAGVSYLLRGGVKISSDRHFTTFLELL